MWIKKRLQWIDETVLQSVLLCKYLHLDTRPIQSSTCTNPIKELENVPIFAIPFDSIRHSWCQQNCPYRTSLWKVQFQLTGALLKGGSWIHNTTPKHWEDEAANHVFDMPIDLKCDEWRWMTSGHPAAQLASPGLCPPPPQAALNQGPVTGHGAQWHAAPSPHKQTKTASSNGF